VASPNDPFAQLRLTGGRFDDHGIPVETLVELVAYRDLVLGIAKELFHIDHPARQRVPRGFSDRLQLRLETIKDGSTLPVLERVLPPGMLLAADDEFTQSRDLIEDAVAAIASGSDLPRSFPRGALVLFNHFGQTLRTDEAIELRRGTASSGPRYTPAIRKALVLKRGRTYQEEVRDIGWVSEVDGNRMSCLIRLQHGPSTPVPAPLDELTFSPVKEVLAPNGEGPPVLISGVGVFDTDRGLIRFDSLHEVSRDDAEDLATLDDRLDELAALPEGWLDGEGVPPDRVVLRRARQVLADLLNLDVPRPRVFATPEGGVQAEWTARDHETSVTFEPNGDLYAVSVNSASGQIEEPELGANNTEQLAQFVIRAS
jgi:hypothetical protein